MNKKFIYQLLNQSSGSSIDPDAQAYFTAAGITSPTEKTAWNATVISLKAAGFYTGNIFYPFLGNTAAQQKYNAVNPLDTDGANRLGFLGTATYTGNGYTPNGVDGEANTFFVPFTGFSGSAGSFGFMSLTSGQGGYDMSCSNGGSANAVLCIARFTNNTAYFGMGTATFSVNVASVDGKGFFATNRKDGTTTEGYKNGLKVATAAELAVPFAGLPLNIGSDGSARFSNRNFAFAFIIPLGLTEAQQLTFYNIINTNFLTPLGRV